ncbi:Arylsulphatase [Basidiobolus meristosporus CBS 931.73]|uniref:Arylsulphatase n=1 Tax=Basidiobolus meristosporus CBS 931.73 TaxID=1314790 RepID=A0A1Y1YH76_9FUNG|nr:Arylsulphatase [Basidiobolus meristosporus CBS 931.73]|eukprot:ORX97372.1 Arylsulphatase [Basidiobolus meristosporus CBS 931.73]
MSLFAATLALGQATDGEKKPNFLIFLMDDQDLKMDSLNYMPRVQKYIASQGTTFKHHYISTAVCCPSRVSFWTGQFPHNHNVTDENPPHGGYPKFLSRQLDSNYLPFWLQQANYTNYYVGKFINGVDAKNPGPPKGWAHFEPLVAPWIYQYLNPTFSLNGAPFQAHQGEYQTDVILNKTLNILDVLKSTDQPFLFTVSPVAPHDTVVMSSENEYPEFYPPVPAERHKLLFDDLKVPRKPNFNPEIQDKPSWLKTLPRLNQTRVDDLDEHYRLRIRSLQAVDELVEKVILKLEKNGQLDNTYIIYTTDNGYHLGQHRLGAGKGTPYEEDVNIPFIIRGPGIAKGEISQAFTTHTHVPATILSLAGLDAPEHLDAPPMPVLEAPSPSNDLTEAFNVEFWADAFFEDTWERFTSNSYKAVRIIGEGYNYYFSTWCTGEHELYDLLEDPYQLRNVHPDVIERDPELINRLNALLNVLRDCLGNTCRDPWKVLHPDGAVRNLRQALSRVYDSYYAQLAVFKFDTCQVFNDRTNEILVREQHTPALVIQAD